MELNWTTFILEILNFLVLVWLLKRFFYQPVQAMVVRRQAAINAQLNKADEQHRQAGQLRQQYENRLADWEEEREAARQSLQCEIETERGRQLQELQQGLEAEREKAGVLAARQQGELVREAEVQALAQGARFVARLLERVASPELEAQLFTLLLAEIQTLPPSQREALQALENGKPVEVVVASAYPLNAEQQQRLQQQLQALVSASLQFTYQQTPKLIAGLRVSVGPWVMHANLHDELKTFAAVVYEQ
jgi:F-type H+-transporting ATPase subunit b